jgi:hypothetical protein
MPAPRAGGARFISRQFLYLMPADLREVSAALQIAMPQLRFVLYPELIDWKATRESGLSKRWRSGFKPVVAVPEASWKIEYINDLNGPDDGRTLYAWLEPANWEPNWEKGSDGFPYLPNRPKLRFEFRVCRTYASLWSNMAGSAPPGLEPDHYLYLVEGRFEGVYYPSEHEKKTFLQRVRRIIDKHTTNQCCSTEPTTLKPVYVSTKGAEDRIGPAAAAWAMAHPRHFLGRDMLKPVEWAEKYPDGWNPG